MLDSMYSSRLNEHGDGPQATQWSNRSSQERRMKVLTEIDRIRDSRILDFGCGTGHLLTYLRQQRGFAGEYVGYDISEAMIQVAQQKFPTDRFERRDILTDPPDETFDFVLANGVFNNRVPEGQELMKALLEKLFTLAKKGLAFNCMSSYVEFFDPELAYYDPVEVFTFCKTNLSALVTLRHDYIVKAATVPFECTFYVYRSDLPLVRPLDANLTR